MRVHIIYGVSGSGKTTRAKAVCDKVNKNGFPYHHLERDSIRECYIDGFSTNGWDGYTPNKESEAIVDMHYNWELVDIRSHLSGDGYLVISDTLCKVSDRRILYAKLRSLGITDITWERMQTDLGTCFTRDEARGVFEVGSDVISNQWNRLHGYEGHI